MRNKQFHFFLLEFSLSLIILSVSLVGAFTIFASSAQLHKETEVLRKLSEEILMNAEALRNPLTLWPAENELKTIITTYDLNGNLSSKGIKYTLSITYDTRTDFHEAQIVLTDKEDKALLTLEVNVLSEVTP
jgi:type II secretory pathway component PulJ